MFFVLGLFRLFTCPHNRVYGIMWASKRIDRNFCGKTIDATIQQQRKMANNIIRHISDDGVEFFTVQGTGESGMSKAGLALFCGVSKMAISKLFKKIAETHQSRVNPGDESQPFEGEAKLRKSNQGKGLKAVNQKAGKESFSIIESLQGKPLNLLTGLVKGTQYSNVDIVPDQVCSIVIMHYAYEAINTTLQAKKSLVLFSSIGLRSYIHAQTGWSADSQNVRAYLTGLILDEPKGWDEHYDADWRLEAERITTWRWSDRVMGKFLNECVYSYFPQEMRDRLDVVNPLDTVGRRPNKQHQHFEGDAMNALQRHIKTVCILMQASSDLTEFRCLMQGKFKGRYQLSLRF
jgi:P63C domain